MNKKRRAIPNAEREVLKGRPKVAKPEPTNTEDLQKVFTVPIIKSEERVVTGVVLQPNVVDAHGDIMSEATIKKAARDFLSNFNKTTTLGLQHRCFNKDIELLESSVLRQATLIGTKIVKKGSWIMTVKVNDMEIWNLIKSGKVTGFSIGGRAKARKV